MLNLGLGNVTMSSSRTLTVSGSTLTVGGVISGNGALTKAGTGLLNLSGINTYSGGTNINAGTLRYDLTSRSTDQTSPGPVLLGNIAINTGGTLQLFTNAGLNYATTTALPENSIFTGAGTITKTGASGIVDLFSGANLGGFSGLK